MRKARLFPLRTIKFHRVNFLFGGERVWKEKNSTRRESRLVIYERVEREREGRLSPIFLPRSRACLLLVAGQEISPSLTSLSILNDVNRSSRFYSSTRTVRARFHNLIRSNYGIQRILNHFGTAPIETSTVPIKLL